MQRGMKPKKVVPVFFWQRPSSPPTHETGWFATALCHAHVSLLHACVFPGSAPGLAAMPRWPCPWRTATHWDPPPVQQGWCSVGGGQLPRVLVSLAVASALLLLLAALVFPSPVLSQSTWGQ